MPPPGWHDDPNDPTSLRYWDGAAWTDQRAPKPAAAAAPTTNQWPTHRIVAAVGAGAVIIGSAMPWVSVTTVFGEISVNGTEGDGQFTIVGGGIVLVLVFLRWYLAALIVASLTGAALIYDYTNVSRNVDIDEEFARASVGWGLQLATVGAIVAAIAAFLLWRGRSPKPADTAATTIPTT